MDTLLSQWQEIVTFAIVGITVLLMIRSLVRKRRMPKDCSHCALVKMQDARQTNK